MTAKPFFPHIFVFDSVCHGALSTCKHFCLDICWQVREGVRGVRGVIIDSWEAGTGVICSSFFLPGRLAFRITVALQNRLIFFCQHSNYIRPISVVTAQSSHLHISAVSTAAIVAGCHADCDSITHFFFFCSFLCQLNLDVGRKKTTCYPRSIQIRTSSYKHCRSLFVYRCCELKIVSEICRGFFMLP